MIHKELEIPHIKHRKNSIYLDTYAKRWGEKEKSGKWDLILQNKHSYVNEDDSYERFKDVIVEMFRGKRPETILDIGCGNAVMWEHLLPFIDEQNIYGVDVAKEMVYSANEKYPNANFYVGDARRLEDLIPKNIKFDAIISRGAVCSHMGFPFFSEILVATKNYKNGILVFDYVNKDFFEGKSRRPSFQMYTEKEMNDLLKTTVYAKENFNIIDENRRDPIVIFE